MADCNKTVGTFGANWGNGRGDCGLPVGCPATCGDLGESTRGTLAIGVLIYITNYDIMKV